MYTHLLVKQPQQVSIVLVNVFTTVWVERGIDSRFPVGSNLELKQCYLHVFLL